MVSKETLFHTILKSNGYSATKSRQAIFNSLIALHHPATLKEIQLLVSSQVDRSSVYRTIDLFVKLNIARRVQIKWKDQFELSEIFLPHHHHIFCEICGKVEELHISDTIESELAKSIASTGYVQASHQLEVSGICHDCQSQVQ